MQLILSQTADIRFDENFLFAESYNRFPDLLFAKYHNIIILYSHVPRNGLQQIRFCNCNEKQAVVQDHIQIIEGEIP